MSLVFNMAGGGSSVEPFAAISVTYPAGSTCTCTDGAKTFTAPNTNGGALFIIPYAATWTVTATDGTDTASETVNITTEGQNVSVELSYTLWLYKDGNEYTAVTGGWRFVKNSYQTGTLAADYILLSALNTEGNRDCSVYTKNKISTSGYSELIVECQVTDVDDDTYGFYAGITTTNTDASELNLVAYVQKNTTGTYTLKLDLSNYQGNYYIKLYVGVAAAKVTKVSLE